MSEPTPRQSAARHGSEEARTIAERGTILQCLAGSTVHGLAIGGQDDRDEVGICVEPPEYVIGLRRVHVPGIRERVPFEQYIYRSQPEGHRPGPGDLDLTIYSLRKFMRLALAGNPSMLLPLFVPDRHVITITPLGEELRSMAPVIISRQAGYRFTGYLERQRESMLSHAGKGRDVTRPELVEKYGYDTKFAGHMVRLGIQGIELLETGHIALPVPEPWRTWIRELRVGGHTMAEALAVTADLEGQITQLTQTSGLPEYPDYDQADRFLYAAYQRVWDGVDG